jgi:hypothetical protein
MNAYDDEPRCHVCGWAERPTNKVRFAERPADDEPEGAYIQAWRSILDGVVICTACLETRARMKAA